MAREGAFRSLVRPVLVSTTIIVAFAFCLFRALADSPWADDVRGGYGGLGGCVAISIMMAVAARRSRERTRLLLPQALTAAQRDEVVNAARSGPPPSDPVVRIEARRLAEQWADARGRSLRVAAAVSAAIAAGCAVLGAMASPWWWGIAALLAFLAGLTLRRDRRAARHLEVLRASTELALPGTEGVHRLVEAEHGSFLGSADRGVLELRIRRPWGGGTSVSSTVVRVAGVLVPSEWGRNRYLVPLGPVLVTVWIDQLLDYGRATTTVDVLPGHEAVVHYSPPALSFLDGRIGPGPQRSPGARGLAAVLLALVVLAVVLTVFFP